MTLPWRRVLAMLPTMFANFAFTLPIMMASFACAFFLAARWGGRQARYWGAGYLIAALAFCMPLVPDTVPRLVRSIVDDAMFATSFWLYGQALLARLRRNSFVPLRAAIFVGSLGVGAYAHVAGDVRLALSASDFGCAMLLLVAIVGARDQARLPGGRVLLVATSLVVLETISRGLTTSLTVPSTGALMATLYVFLMQSLAMILAPVMALAALGAIVLDVLETYRGQALTDPLSGLFNRRGFDARTRATGGSVVLCDIDRFKTINDRFGHAAGDRAIVAMAGVINLTLPRHATAARVGGEEFLVHLPGFDAPMALTFADGLRRTFAGFDWPSIGIDGPLTASFGVAAYRANETTLDYAIDRAACLVRGEGHRSRSRR